jgi:hypothetical protein
MYEKSVRMKKSSRMPKREQMGRRGWRGVGKGDGVIGSGDESDWESSSNGRSGSDKAKKRRKGSIGATIRI